MGFIFNKFITVNKICAVENFFIIRIHLHYQDSVYLLRYIRQIAYSHLLAENYFMILFMKIK